MRSALEMAGGDAGAYRRALARVLRRVRREADLSRADVARAWGCTPSNVTKAELALKRVSAEQVRALAQLARREPASLLLDVEAELLRITHGGENGGRDPTV